MYDWTTPLPPCDWCDVAATDEDVPWIDNEDFWGHEECYPAWSARPEGTFVEFHIG